MKHFKMKQYQLCYLLSMLLVLPTLANAEIYKWKDKDGVMRYTDTPPPSNVKQENIVGKKFIKPTGQAPLSPVTTAGASGKEAASGKEVVTGKDPAEKAESAEETAAKLRQKNAEIEKHNKQEKETQAKVKEDNCSASKANLASYQQGGRVYKMNEKGEREYLDDAGLKQGAEKAQKDVAQYCNS